MVFAPRTRHRRGQMNLLRTKLSSGDLESFRFSRGVELLVSVAGAIPAGVKVTGGSAGAGGCGY